MNRTPHTVGPWIAKDHYINTDQGRNSICIAQVNNGAERFDEHPEELEANAILIAAAPDLLEALEGCMKALARLIGKHDPDSIEAEWIGHANEAIRKATGEGAIAEPKKASSEDICFYACGHDAGYDCAPGCVRNKAKGEA